MKTIEETRREIYTKYPAFAEEWQGDSFAEESGHYFMARFADFVVEYALEPSNETLTLEIKDYLLKLFSEGDEHLINTLYVSFLEGLVDRAYKYPTIKLIINELSEEAKSYLRSFFIPEVIEAIGL